MKPSRSNSPLPVAAPGRPREPARATTSHIPRPSPAATPSKAAAPAVYRPQPVPRCLQLKTPPGARAGVVPPAVPHAHRREPEKVSRPGVPPPKLARPVQPKSAPLAQSRAAQLKAVRPPQPVPAQRPPASPTRKLPHTYAAQPRPAAARPTPPKAAGGPTNFAAAWQRRPVVIQRASDNSSNVQLPISTHSQPTRKDNAHHAKLCSLYSGLAALEITQGSSFDEAKALEALEKHSARDGGSPHEFYKSYGLVTSLSYSPPKKAKAVAAFARNMPVAVAVSWDYVGKDGEKKEGNHWLYAVEINGKEMVARDQQNGHVEVKIDMSTWKGAAQIRSTAWNYKVTGLSIGCPTKDDWKAVYDA